MSEQAPEQEPKEAGGLDLDEVRAALANVRRELAQSQTRLEETEAATEQAVADALERGRAEANEGHEALALENRDLPRKVAALEHGLPKELAACLSGDTPEELEAHAKVLAQFVPAPQVAYR